MKKTVKPGIIKVLVVTGFTIVTNFSLLGQSLPFPQNVTYPYGFKPSTVNSTYVKSEYDRWKNSLLVDCNGTYRVIYTDNTSQTRGEAIGFGMLLSGYVGDKMVFDKLYDFYKLKRTVEANNMMAWNVTCDDYVDKGSATDVDIDVAFALIVGYIQWGGTYLDDARVIINNIKEKLIITCNGVHVLAPGYKNGAWGGCSETDIQYYTPAYFRIFAAATNDDVWNTLANDTYTILNASANSLTGLVPDWQAADGGLPPSYRTAYFHYDACRVPWRIALDYIWNGNLQAKEWCTKVSNWAYQLGVQNIKDGYDLNGTPHNNNNHNSAFVGGFAVASMCNDQTKANAFGTEMNTLADTYWFNLCTRCLYLFTMSGNFWKPDPSLVSINSPENQKKKYFNICPNPSRSGDFIFNVSQKLHKDQKLKISFVDAAGKIAFNKTLSTIPYTFSVQTGLSKGVYLLVMSGKDIHYSEKLIIE